MRVWRISRREHRSFDGAGGRIANARWNRRGAPVVYTAGSLALAALEFLVHLPPDLNLKGLVAVSADIPESVSRETIEIFKFPAEWRDIRHVDRLRDLGMDWLAAARTAVLVVPSAVIPQDRNYLLNSAHPHFTRIRINPPEAFEFDYRMWKSR